MNVPEYGTIKTPDGLEALLVQDAYLRVRDDAHYPPVLLATAENDPFVPVWQSAKMTARLQSARHGAGPALLRLARFQGHRGDSSTDQQVARYADFLSFMWDATQGTAPFSAGTGARTE